LPGGSHANAEAVRRRHHRARASSTPPGPAASSAAGLNPASQISKIMSGNMSELDQEALFHRSLNDRTDWTANLPYDVGALPERYSDAFRRAGAQTAYTVASNGLVPILFKLKKEQDFAKYATRWENDHSKLIHGHGAGRVFPVVNEDMTVIGHYGTFSNYEVYAPIDGKFDLDAKVTQGKVLVERGATSAQIDEDLMTVKDTLDQAFRRQRDRELQRQGYIPNQAAKPETYYTVITDPDGCVLMVTGAETRGAIQPSSVSIVDLIAIPRLVLLIGQGIARRIILCAARKLIARRVARGGAQELSAAGRVMAKELPPPPPPFVPKETPPVIAKQARKVTPEDVLAWEKEGGHAARDHGPHHTRETLKARILKKQSIPAPKMLKGGIKPKDLRVWQKNFAPSASKWASDETMRKAIGDVVGKNLDDIRRATAAGRRFTLLQQEVGYRTGSGWVAVGETAEDSAAYFHENLRRVSIIFEARTPTAANPEPWYVLTAYPSP
jgi:hypothetical protein